MHSRRDFLGALLGATLVGGCREQDQQQTGPAARAGAGPAAPGGKQKAGGSGGGAGAPYSEIDEGALQRERVRPPVSVPRSDTLSGIRRVKAPGAEMVVVAGRDGEKMVRLGLEAIGGIKLFVSPGDVVVLTPNFALARHPRYAATTSPEVVREVIRLCREAGAADIICLDHTYNPTPDAFRVNGAYVAVQGTGARLLSPRSLEQYVVVDDFLRGKLHRERLGWQAVASPLLRCDLVINLPVFKHHREAGVTGALKKMMGCVWRRMSYHEAGLQECIAELATVIRPTLTIMDATRVLTTNGPDGPGKVEQVNRIVLSLDPVLADAYACQWMNLEPKSVTYLARAAALGAGSLDVGRAKVEHVGL